MIRHAKFELGQDVTSELELGTLFMTREQMEKVGPYTYNWGYAPEHGWKAIENGVADFIVLEHAPHTRGDVEPGWKDMFSVPLGMTGAQEFVPLMMNAVNQGKLSITAAQSHKLNGKPLPKVSQPRAQNSRYQATQPPSSRPVLSASIRRRVSSKSVRMRTSLSST